MVRLIWMTADLSEIFLCYTWYDLGKKLQLVPNKNAINCLTIFRWKNYHGGEFTSVTQPWFNMLSINPTRKKVAGIKCIVIVKYLMNNVNAIPPSLNMDSTLNHDLFWTLYTKMFFGNISWKKIINLQIPSLKF